MPDTTPTSPPLAKSPETPSTSPPPKPSWTEVFTKPAAYKNINTGVARPCPNVQYPANKTGISLCRIL